MNETSINNAIRELEEMTDLLRKILERKITQKQAADKLGITPQAFQTELKNSFSNYIKKRNIITEDLLLKCLEEIETPCERIAKDIFGIAEYEKLVIIDTENQELFLQRMKDILSEREMSIMSLRYGINTDEPMTLRKIGEQFGVQQQRIRQILAKCLHKLRNPANSQLLLPNYQRYAKALQSCQEVQAVSDNLEKAYERTVEKYTWLLHKKELVDKAPEIRRQLENMIQISDMVIPENWKEILKSKGIITVFDYLEADHAELEKTKEFCPDFSCSVLDTMFGVPTQEVKSIAASAIRISTLNLSTRTYKALLCAGIITLGDLTKKSRKEIMEIRNFGRSCYEELETILSKDNISLMED